MSDNDLAEALALLDLAVVGIVVLAALAFLYLKVWRRVRAGRCSSCGSQSACKAAAKPGAGTS